MTTQELIDRSSTNNKYARGLGIAPMKPYDTVCPDPTTGCTEPIEVANDEPPVNPDDTVCPDPTTGCTEPKEAPGGSSQ